MVQMLKYLNLPEVLKMNDGTPVTVENFPARRDEIRELLQREMYGTYPEKTKDVSVFSVESHGEVYSGIATYEVVNLRLGFEKGAYVFPIPLFMPKGVDKPACIVTVGSKPDHPFFRYPPREVLERGYAVAFAPTECFSKDGPEPGGITDFCFPNGRQPTDAGSLLMWGYGCSYVYDYLELSGRFDMKNIGVAGCSRNGKGALLAGLFDERFAFINSVCSGCAGSAILRGKVGETAGSIYDYSPFWFTTEFKKYGGKEETLPFDAHFLLAALAPRYVLVTGAIEDFWCDPYSEMLACIAATPAYELFPRTKGLIYESRDRVPGPRYPVPGDFYHEGSIGYSLRYGGHGFPDYDWMRICDWMDYKKVM